MNLHHRPREHGPALEPQRAGDGEARPGGEAPCPACLNIQGWGGIPTRVGASMGSALGCLWVGSGAVCREGAGVEGKALSTSGGWREGTGQDRTGREAGPACRVLGDLCDVSFILGVHSPRCAIPAHLFLILLKQKS